MRIGRTLQIGLVCIIMLPLICRGALERNSVAHYNSDRTLDRFPHLICAEVVDQKEGHLYLKNVLILQNLDSTKPEKFASLAIPQYNVLKEFKKNHNYLILVDRKARDGEELQIWPTSFSALHLSERSGNSETPKAWILSALNKEIISKEISEENLGNLMRFCLYFGLIDAEAIKNLKLKLSFFKPENIELAAALLIGAGDNEAPSVFSSLSDRGKARAIHSVFAGPTVVFDVPFSLINEIFLLSPGTAKTQILRHLSKDEKPPTKEKAALMLAALNGKDFEDKYFAACYFIRALQIKGLLVPSVDTFKNNVDGIMLQIHEALKKSPFKSLDQSN